MALAAVAPVVTSVPTSREEQLHVALDAFALASSCAAAVLADDDGLPLAASAGVDDEQAVAWAAASAHALEAADTVQRLMRHHAPAEVAVALGADERLHVVLVRSPAGRLALAAVGPQTPDRAALATLTRALHAILA